MKNNRDSQYFRLFSCCTLVKGAVRSVICDLQRSEVKLIPNSMYTILTEHREQTYKEIREIYDNDEILDQYYDFLVEQEYGFWTETPELFPPLDLSWDTPSLINNAIIDVDEQSSHDFQKILEQLEELGCDHLQIRYYHEITCQELREHLSATKSSRFKSLELLMKTHHRLLLSEIESLFIAHARLYRVVAYAAPNAGIQEVLKPGSEASLGQLIMVPGELTPNDHCGVIDPYFFASDTKTFTEAQNFNTCLNGKIGIDVKGEIKNCPSLDKSFGNIREVSLHQALLKKDFKALWEINKDQVETCKDCEFRYICTDCRAFIQNPEDIYSKPSKCSYDPYTATWEDA